MSSKTSHYAPVDTQGYTANATPQTSPSPKRPLFNKYYALDPLEMARPPFPDGHSRGEGSPDSNDQENEMFITPANSARPSVITALGDGGDPPLGAGLGIGMGPGLGFPGDQRYYSMVGEAAEEPSPKSAHASKPSLTRSKSAESNLQTRRSAGKPLGWQNVNSYLPAAPSDNGLPSSGLGYSSSRSPTMPAVNLADTPHIRERVVSPSRETFPGQQSSYIPDHLSINPPAGPSHQFSVEPSPAADGKKEPRIRTPVSSSGSMSSNGPYPYSEPSRTRALRSTHNNYFPVNVPTGSDLAASRLWQAGDSKVRSISQGEKGQVLSGMSSGLGPEKFTDSAAYWLGLYFFFNLGLTLFNKFVLVSFPFPYTLTGLHALSGCVGCYVALERGSFTPARLTHRENLILCAFSVLYTINIAVSNISLQLVTVPFHQVVRASTPFFTILTSALLLGTRFTMAKMVALLPVVAGVGFATYGDYYFTAWGLVLTLLGTFLAALKTVATNLIQTGGGGRLKLHPLDLLMRMSPLAFVQCVVYGWYTGELERVRQYGATQMTRGKAIALLINGVIACGLNIVSFTANKKSGPLTMTVSANCKQVMTIALAVVLFDLNISITNAIGILLTLVGGVWYGMVEYRDKQRRLSKMGRA